jgi:hypothetical protein
MFAETGVPVLLGLFCEINAGMLATAARAVAAHSATAYWDQAYAEPRRRVTPVEQHVHSLLEMSTRHGDIPAHRPALGPGQGARRPGQVAAPVPAPAQAPRPPVRNRA